MSDLLVKVADKLVGLVSDPFQLLLLLMFGACAWLLVTQNRRANKLAEVEIRTCLRRARQSEARILILTGFLMEALALARTGSGGRRPGGPIEELHRRVMEFEAMTKRAALLDDEISRQIHGEKL